MMRNILRISDLRLRSVRLAARQKYGSRNKTLLPNPTKRRHRRASREMIRRDVRSRSLSLRQGTIRRRKSRSRGASHRQGTILRRSRNPEASLSRRATPRRRSRNPGANLRQRASRQRRSPNQGANLRRRANRSAASRAEIRPRKSPDQYRPGQRVRTDVKRSMCR